MRRPTTSSPAAVAAVPDASRRPGNPWVLPLGWVVQLLLALDFAIVNVALSTIQQKLQVPPAVLPWVATGYALTFGAFLMAGGRLGDRFGLRRVLLVGMAVFALASLSGGLAGGSVQLVVSRLVQGAGAALMAPTAFALVSGEYADPARRARAVSLFQGSNAVGGLAGVLLGGLLTATVGWRWVLLINPPVIVLVAALVLLHIPAARGRAATRVVERRRVDRVRPATLLADGRWSVLAATALLGGVMGGYAYFVALYLQDVLRLNAAAAGLAFLPATLTGLVASTQLAPRLLPRIGSRRGLVIALTVLALGQLCFVRLPSSEGSVVDVLVGALPTAVGLGLAFPAAALLLTDDVPEQHRGVAAALFPTGQQIGAAAGLAVLAAVAAGPGSSAAPHYDRAFLAAAVLAAIGGLLVVLFGRRRTPRRPGSGVRIEDLVERARG